MTSLRDVLKASKGIIVDDPIAAIWDMKLAGGYTIAELSGKLPLTIRPDGTALLDYRIYGNTVQDGEPTPENPVEVVGCGVRTENLFDKDATNNYGYYNGNTGEFLQSNSYRYWRIPVSEGDFVYVKGSAQGLGCYFKDGQYVSKAISTIGGFIVPSGVDELTNNMIWESAETFVVTKNHPISNYIPYGYRLPMVSRSGQNSITTPIYTGTEPLHKIGDYADYVDYSTGKIVRRIKKLVLTGEERMIYENQSGIMYMYRVYITSLPAAYDTNDIYCSHYQPIKTAPSSSTTIESAIKPLAVSAFIRFYSLRTTLDDFKQFLASEYTKGTPVTVWYVLAEPEIEDPPVPLPALPTFDDAETVIDYEEEPKPSEIYIKYKGAKT